MLAEMHREDVVATIRKQYGSVAEFERQSSLPAKSVNEVLRGRPNRRVTDAVNALLENSTKPLQPEHSGSSARKDGAHRLNHAA